MTIHKVVRPSWHGQNLIILQQVKRAMEDLARARQRTKEERKEKEFMKQHLENALRSDETFAYIAGYTSNGVPFGTTHEEMEEDMKNSVTRLKASENKIRD